MKRLISFIISIFIMISAWAQVPSRMPNDLLRRLEKSKPDSNRIKLLFQLSDFYLANSIKNKNAGDSSLWYLQQSIKLTDSIHNAYWRHEALRHLGLYYFDKGDTKRGKEYFLKITSELDAAGDKKAEIRVWSDLYSLIHPRDSSDITRLTCLKRIQMLYRQLNDKENEILTLKDIADAHMNYGQLDTAEAELLNVLKMYKAINYRNLHYTYDLLAVTNRYRGNFQKALFYALKTIESMEATKDTAAATTFYSRLANIYRELNDPQNSIKWYWEVFRNRTYKGPNNLYMFRDAGFLARELIKLNRRTEALRFIQDIALKNKPVGKYARASLKSTFAYCYHALGRDDLAENYYLDVIKLANDLERNNEITADINYELGQFFYDRKQFPKASFHFQKALDVSPGINSAAVIKDIQLKLFTVDSVQGHYDSAIGHIRKYDKLKDSIFNETKSRQLQELQVQYETSQKEKNIQLLHNQNQLEQIKVSQANRTKNITFAGIILLLIVIGSLFNSYRTKQKANKKLERQGREIEKQNRALRLLVEEKEWLLKEVHHRVKNNLHTVICLLESQAAYLENDALKAIENSEHRIYAMSLIHQKLYQSDDIKTIDMAVYVPELIRYLEHSFDTQNQIQFKLKIDPVHLTLSHAIPLGLIINEAVTNSIKYAFPGKRGGEISISMIDNGKKIIMELADNGIGMPKIDFSTESKSLGLELMKGLSKDVEAEISFDAANGTKITVIFEPDALNDPGSLLKSPETKKMFV